MPHLGELSSEGMCLPLVHKDAMSSIEKESLGSEVNWAGFTSWLHYLHAVPTLNMCHLRQDVNPLVELSAFLTW